MLLIYGAAEPDEGSFCGLSLWQLARLDCVTRMEPMNRNAVKDRAAGRLLRGIKKAASKSGFFYLLLVMCFHLHQWFFLRWCMAFAALAPALWRLFAGLHKGFGFAGIGLHQYQAACFQCATDICDRRNITCLRR